MNLEPFFTRRRSGLLQAWESLIDGRRFPCGPDKMSDDEARNTCLHHVAALVDLQDGDSPRPELTLAMRRDLFRRTLEG